MARDGSLGIRDGDERSMHFALGWASRLERNHWKVPRRTKVLMGSWERQVMRCGTRSMREER